VRYTGLAGAAAPASYCTIPAAARLPRTGRDGFAAAGGKRLSAKEERTK